MICFIILFQGLICKNLVWIVPKRNDFEKRNVEVRRVENYTELELNPGKFQN